MFFRKSIFFCNFPKIYCRKKNEMWSFILTACGARGPKQLIFQKTLNLFLFFLIFKDLQNFPRFFHNFTILIS